MHKFFVFFACLEPHLTAILENGYAKNKCVKSKQTFWSLAKKQRNQNKHLNQTKCSNQNAYQHC